MNFLPFRECGVFLGQNSIGLEFQTVLAEKSSANAATLYM